MHEISISTGVPPQTLLEELTALPRLPSRILRVLLVREGKGAEGIRGDKGEMERGKGS